MFFSRLDGTEISGRIPSFIGNWTNLRRLDIQGTFMEGPFPPEFSLLLSLTQLIASCLRKDLPCDGMAKNYNLFINCGGERVVVDGNEYEPDPSLEGTSKYYLSRSGKWALSSTGNFIGGSRAPFVAENTSTLTMPNAELYTSARLNPLSLKYYGLCLQPGNYTVKLHFAEIVFTSGPTFGNLGRREKVLRNFNIVEAANGTGKEVIRNFTALVEGGTLEIHFVWSGKGTNSIPYRSVYGPLISAISVTPNYLSSENQGYIDVKIFLMIFETLPTVYILSFISHLPATLLIINSGQAS
ncbi:unnamed protein product [Spirodela intermedia]|uniref:Malectin domain-containing protein n=1 Tax=Spirodela intermedia TaxID=51605 RepID=A0A7I8J8B0_SPIIN|nr:unnamed protein product [Spirodela intermedia]CAA6665672.1 unnamed protein product [Spirodela intermedia]